MFFPSMYKQEFSKNLNLINIKIINVILRLQQQNYERSSIIGLHCF